MKRKLLDFNELSNKLKGLSNKDKGKNQLMKILINKFKNNEKNNFTCFFENLKKEWLKDNLNKEKRKYVLKSLVKSEEFKLNYNQKIFYFKLWRNNAKSLKLFEGMNLSEKFKKNVQSGVELLKAFMNNKLKDTFPNLKEYASRYNTIKHLKRVYNKFDNSQKNQLKKYFNSWRNMIASSKVNDLKNKIIKAIINYIEKRARESILREKFNRWKIILLNLNKKIKKTKKTQNNNNLKEVNKSLS